MKATSAVCNGERLVLEAREDDAPKRSAEGLK